MICVLDVTSGPARGKRFWLRSNQQVEVGRISSADFAVPADPHMSRRHMILEGTLSAFRVRDVGSVNGTYVNNAKISAVELCSGDRIRAGETIFEVSVLDDDQNPHGKDGISFSSSISKSLAPATLAPKLGQGQLDPQDATSRFAAGNRPEQGLPAAGFDDADQTRRCVLPEQLRQDALPGKFPASIRTMLSNNTWWADFNFCLSDVPCLLDETDERPTQTSLMPEMLQRLEPEFTITAVVDVERLGRFGRQQLATLVELGLVTWHAPNVCSIIDNRSRDFVRTIESALAQDALIVLGSRGPLNPTWLEYFVGQVSRPSQLDSLLRDPHCDVVHRLLSTVDFVLYERDRRGKLSLLLRDLVELSE